MGKAKLFGLKYICDAMVIGSAYVMKKFSQALIESGSFEILYTYAPLKTSIPKSGNND